MATDNDLSAFQVIAIQGLQNGEGVAPPNIQALYDEYLGFAPVGNFANIYVNANANVTISESNITLLQSIGCNSFPQLFGVIPYEYSSEIGIGLVFDICPKRTEAWFGNSSIGGANVYINVLSQAQMYAQTAQSVISSAANTQWNGDAVSTATGGFSNIAGNNFKEVGERISEMGTLLLPPYSRNGFSNAGCFQSMYDNGDKTIGNLNRTFFDQPLTDPSTGNVYIINDTLFNKIINNSVGMGDDDSNKIAALNPLDIVLGQYADNALSDTGDLDAVVTYFNVGPNIASGINNWTDCLNVSGILGSNLSNVVASAMNVPTCNAYSFIQGLNSITGFTNVPDMTTLGEIMMSLQPMGTSPNLANLTTPLSDSDIANVQASFGPGSGTYGNPTVDDILGSTNYNGAIANTIPILQSLLSNDLYIDISTDTGNIANALLSFPSNGVKFSDGTVYYNLNDVAVYGSNLINMNANVLYSQANANSLISYNKIAETHNNSANLTSFNSFIPINTIPLQTNSLADYDEVSGFTGMVLGVINRFFGASQNTSVNNPPQPAMYQKFPMNGNPSMSLQSFPSSLASMAAANASNPAGDETTGLNNVSNCLDMGTTTGQALKAVIIHTQNMQVLSNSGIPPSGFDSKYQ